jgi:flagellar biosynthesis/type III secretory pathway M-ring protein FliF/YscJ
MPEFLAEIRTQIGAIWARLDGGQRLTIAAVVLAALVGLGGILWYSSLPDYQVAWSGDDPRQLAEATGSLSQTGIAFKQEGRNLLVERGSLDAARGALLRDGVMGGGDPETGDPIGSITMDRESRLDALAAKNGKRASHALLQMDGVLAADVRHMRPKRSPFSAEDADTRARAAVVLRIRSGESFSRLARSAVDVVAAALGVPPDAVTVIDSLTKQRFQLDAGNRSGLDDNEFIDQQRRRSETLSGRAQAMLERLYPDKAQVLVTVMLDPNWEVRREKVAPDRPVLREERITKDSTEDGRGGGASGDPSSTAAATAGTEAAPAAARSTTKKDLREKVYEPIWSELESGKLAPDVLYMSVALVLDESVDAGKQAQIEALIKSAIGWDELRDKGRFSVLREKLEPPPPLETPTGPDPLELAERFGPIVGQVLAVLIVLLFLKRLLKRTPAPAKSGARAAAAAAPPEAELPPEEITRRMRREIEKAIAEDPSSISQLLESWLAEQKS